MAVTAAMYGLATQSAFNKEIDLDSDTIKVMLVGSWYTPSQDTHRYKSSVTNEITGTGYTAGGATLGSPSVTYTAGTNTLAFDGADVSWTTATFTARYAVIYDSTPATDATRPLLAYVDFGEDLTVTAATFTIAWAAAGILTITVA